MKKIVAVFFFLLFFIIVFLPQNAFASQNKEDIEEKLEQNIQIQLDNLDFSVSQSIFDQSKAIPSGIF